MAKSSGIKGSSGSASRPPKAAKQKKNGGTTKKSGPPPSSKKTAPPPSLISGNSLVDKKSTGRSTTGGSDSYSWSGESRTTTEGTTRLVDNLVDAYTGEGSSDSLYSHRNDYSQGSAHRNSSSYFNESRCEEYVERTEQQFKNLDQASERIATAQARVEETLDQAVEAKLYDQPEVAEQKVKKAERDQERLIKAEGKLHRAKCELTGKHDARRQQKQDVKQKKEVAEAKLQRQFHCKSPEVRDYLLEKMRPLLWKDPSLRENPEKLKQVARAHLKNDTEGNRLLRESEPREPVPVEDRGDAPKDKRNEENLLDCRCPDSRAKRREKRKKQRLKQRLQTLRSRVESPRVQEKLKATAPEKRGAVLKRELEPLKRLAPGTAQELEQKLTKSLAETQQREAERLKTRGLTGKSQNDRKRVTESLLKSKEVTAGGVTQNSQPLDEAVEQLDRESVEQTAETLKSLNNGTATSLVDLTRAFGRDVTQVREDLEQQIARGGGFSTHARKTLRHLDRALRRAKLFSVEETWAALRKSTENIDGRPRFGQVSEGGAPPGSKDRGVARSLLRRLETSGTKAKSREEARILYRVQSLF